MFFFWFRLKVSMLPILVHETLPGHHYQIATVMLSSLPNFRRYTVYGHHDQGAFNFPYHGVYSEVSSDHITYKPCQMPL